MIAIQTHLLVFAIHRFNYKHFAIAALTFSFSLSIKATRLSMTLMSIVISRVKPGVSNLGSKKALNSAKRSGVLKTAAIDVI